jgi:hypothetical protein
MLCGYPDESDRLNWCDGNRRPDEGDRLVVRSRGVVFYSVTGSVFWSRVAVFEVQPADIYQTRVIDLEYDLT